MNRKWAFALASVALLIGAPAEARWRVATSDHFTIYSEQAAAPLQKLADTLERYDAALRLVTGTAPSVATTAERITIFQVSSTGDIRAMTGGSRSMVAGFYVPRSGNSVLFTPSSIGVDFGYDPITSITPMHVLLHEYAHHFLFFNAPAAVPSWYSEGFAEFGAPTKFNADGSVVIGNAPGYRAQGLAQTGLRASDLLSGAKLRPGIGVDQYYGKSWALAHLLLLSSDIRRKQFNEYMRQVSGGTPAEKAAETFGDVAALDHEFDRYVASRKIPGIMIGANALHPTASHVAELSDGADAMMPVRIASWRGVDPQQAKATVTQARAVAARFKNDPFVLDALMEAEFDANNHAEARDAAQRELAVAPNSARAMDYMGRSLQALAVAAKLPASAPEWNAIRRWFINANHADNGDPAPLFDYYNSYAAAGEAPGKSAIAGLEEAARVSPQDQKIQLAFVRESLRTGDIGTARARMFFVRTAHGAKSNLYQPVWAALDANDADAAGKALDAAMAKKPTAGDDALLTPPPPR